MTIAKNPLSDLRWAVDGSNVDAANISAPSSGQRDTGFTTNQIPTSGSWNSFWNKWYRQAQYLDALLTNGGNSFGKAIGHMDLGNDAEATVAPISVSRDYLGNIRELVDHNGFRMGQVTERDETWEVPSAILATKAPMASAVPTSGTWSFATGSWVGTVSGTLQLSLSSVIPIGAVVTGVTFSYTKSVAGDTLVFSMSSQLNGAAAGTAVTKTINTGTGNATTSFASPTSGTLPKQNGFNAGTLVDDLLITVTSTLTGTATIYGITVSYVVPPSAGWLYTAVTLDTSATGDLLTMADPQSGLNQRGAKLTAAAISGVAGNSQLTGPPECFLDDNAAYVAEWMVRAGTITDGSAHRLFKLGINGSSGHFAGFYTDNTFATWQLQVIDGAGTANTDSAVTVAASTVYRMRIEILGGLVSSATTGKSRIRGFINGTKVYDVVSNSFTNEVLAPFFKVATNGTTGGPYDCTIGRIRRAWNHRASGDNV